MHSGDCEWRIIDTYTFSLNIHVDLYFVITVNQKIGILTCAKFIRIRFAVVISHSLRSHGVRNTCTYFMKNKVNLAICVFQYTVKKNCKNIKFT